MSATNITSKCRIASIAPDDVMILRHDANLRRMEFSERTGSPQGDVELMTQKKVLDFKPAWWLEQIGYEGCKQVDDRKHRIG